MKCGLQISAPSYTVCRYWVCPFPCNGFTILFLRSFAISRPSFAISRASFGILCYGRSIAILSLIRVRMDSTMMEFY